MTIIISIVIFLILTMQTFFLGGTVWLGIVGMLLSAAGVVLPFVLKKRKKYLSNVSALAGIVISVVCCLFITSDSGTGTLRQKEILLGQMVSAETAENAEEKYAAQYYMRAEEADKSRSMLFKLKNITSIDYYCTMAEWYNKFDKGNFSYVVSTLLDAVAEHPYWAKGHLMLGLSYYENNDNTSAIYYLKKAHLLDMSDGYSLCYLGVIL